MKLQGGDFKKLSQSGITVGGNIPLEECIDTLQAVETIEEHDRENAEQRKSIYRGARIRYAEAKEKDGRCVSLQSEVNLRNLEVNMENAVTMKDVIYAALLAGDKLDSAGTGKLLTDNLKRRVSAGSAATVLTGITRSEVGVLLDIEITSERNGKRVISLMPEARNLTIPNLTSLCLKSNPYGLSDAINDCQQLKDMESEIWRRRDNWAAIMEALRKTKGKRVLSGAEKKRVYEPDTDGKSSAPAKDSDAESVSELTKGYIEQALEPFKSYIMKEFSNIYEELPGAQKGGVSVTPIDVNININLSFGRG